MLSLHTIITPTRMTDKDLPHWTSIYYTWHLDSDHRHSNSSPSPLGALCSYGQVGLLISTPWLTRASTRFYHPFCCQQKMLPLLQCTIIPLIGDPVDFSRERRHCQHDVGHSAHVMLSSADAQTIWRPYPCYDTQPRHLCHGCPRYLHLFDT